MTFCMDTPTCVTESIWPIRKIPREAREDSGLRDGKSGHPEAIDHQPQED